MLTVIWLAFTTGLGYAIGHFFFADYVILSSAIGFIVGLVIRFATGEGGDWDSSGFGDWGGSDGGSDSGGSD
jgi:hypothetical protein